MGVSPSLWPSQKPNFWDMAYTISQIISKESRMILLHFDEVGYLSEDAITALCAGCKYLLKQHPFQVFVCLSGKSLLCPPQVMYSSPSSFFDMFEISLLSQEDVATLTTSTLAANGVDVTVRGICFKPLVLFPVCA